MLQPQPVLASLEAGAKLMQGLSRHFGKHVISQILQLDESDPNVEILWLQIYSVSTL